MKNLIECMLMLLIFSAALLSTTFAQNQAGYTTANNNVATAATTNMTTTSNASSQINPGAKSTYVTQLANVSAIFGVNKAEDINITYANSVGGRWVEIANEGIAARNMTGWRLTNRENSTYTFSNISLDSGSILRIHEGSGIRSGINIYTNSTMPLFNESGDVITLLDPQDEIAAEYTVFGNASAPTKTQGTAPVLVNASNATPVSVRNPATQPILITPATPGAARNPATAPLLFNTSARANATGNQTCPVGQAFCNGACTDISIDSQNCGKCGNICPADTTCINGVCSSPCLPGQISCNGTCVDTGSNSQNCGACGKKCPPEAVCINGVCTVAVS